MLRLARLMAAFVIVLWTAAASAVQVTPLNDQVVSVEVSARGATRDAAMDLVRQEAVLATSGRVLLQGELVRADELLEKYLRNYAANFVTGVEVLADRFTAGQTELFARVFVDYTALVEDLREKRFLYSPAHKPMFAVFIEDRLENETIDAAQKIFTASLVVEGMKAYEGSFDEPQTTDNLLDDPELLRQGIIAAERRNVEILFTGTSRTTLREERKVYYDTFFFYDCELTITMIRVDTGEVLKEMTARGSASARERSDAISVAIERASASIADEMSESYRDLWPKVVQAKADYSILLTGATDELINIVTQHLSGLGADTRIELRKKFDRSAVLTVKTTVSRDALIERIRNSTYPALKIVREEGRDKLEVQVSG